MFQIQPTYTRDDPRGRLPYLTGLPHLDRNRLAFFWRPLIDLADSEVASVRLRMIAPMSEWLADLQTDRWPSFSLIGVPGLRHQVLRHAGLHRYVSHTPTDLPGELRTPGWQRLVEVIAGFSKHHYSAQALILFHLAQLSYVRYALGLAGDVTPNGVPDHDQFVYHVARLHARHPGHASRALRLFGELIAFSRDPVFTLDCAFQGIGHAINAGNLDLAHRFEEHIDQRSIKPEGWYGCLLRSRVLRALGMLRKAEGQTATALREIDGSLDVANQLAADSGPSGSVERLLALENIRRILEVRIQLAVATGSQEVIDFCERLGRTDPYCVDARLVIGDGYAAIVDYRGAAAWYARAGELGTASGAIGWFRAAQCHHALGERGQAVHAMGRCLELDASAVEPRAYIAEHIHE